MGQFKTITETHSINLYVLIDGPLDTIIARLEEYRTAFGGQSKLEFFVSCDGDVEAKLEVTRLETIEERTSRLERERKLRERIDRARIQKALENDARAADPEWQEYVRLTKKFVRPTLVRRPR